VLLAAGPDGDRDDARAGQVPRLEVWIGSHPQAGTGAEVDAQGSAALDVNGCDRLPEQAEHRGYTYSCSRLQFMPCAACIAEPERRFYDQLGVHAAFLAHSRRPQAEPHLMIEHHPVDDGADQ
jgi:hypothetical protein